MSLSQEEIDSCRKSFQQYDADKSGTIDEEELTEILQAMGYNLSGEEIFCLISEFCDSIV
jgi:Ca2+-binding EF-hand superfamily protein